MLLRDSTFMETHACMCSVVCGRGYRNIKHARRKEIQSESKAATDAEAAAAAATEEEAEESKAYLCMHRRLGSGIQGIFRIDGKRIRIHLGGLVSFHEPVFRPSGV
jgi:hypothetical protein